MAMEKADLTNHGEGPPIRTRTTAVSRQRAARGRTGRTIAATVVMLALGSAGCAGTKPGHSTAAGPTVTTAATPEVSAQGGSVSASSVSTGQQVAARNIRLVRIGTADLALQFEFANEGDKSISPADLGWTRSPT